jgi:hypothetical protein
MTHTKRGRPVGNNLRILLALLSDRGRLTRTQIREEMQVPATAGFALMIRRAVRSSLITESVERTCEILSEGRTLLVKLQANHQATNEHESKSTT